MADYRAACERCEQWRVIETQGVYLKLRAVLFYDKRATGARGLCLKEDLPDLRLLKGDRVEPCEDVPDIGMLEHLEEFPARVLFWRPSAETLARHKNPLFNDAIGFTPYRCVGVDWLHTLSLGIFQTWCSATLHELFRVDAWQTLSANEAARVRMSTQRLSAELELWTAAQGDNRNLTKIRPLQQDDFGTHLHPKFPLKGGETNTFLEFMVSVALPRSQGPLGELGGPLLRAGRDLLRILSLIREHPVTFPVAAIQSFHDAARSYEHVMTTLGMNPKPKDHMLIHLSSRLRQMGSPALYANWIDESYNRLLRDVAARAHGRVVDRRILVEFPRAYRSEKRARLH